MNDADDEPIIPPSDRKSEPGNSPDAQALMGMSKQPTAHRPVSMAPAPISGVRGGVYFPAPPPSIGHMPIEPRGFVAFANAPEKLKASAEAWRVPLDRIPAKDDLAAYGRAIEAYLAEANERAAGILSNGGDVIWASDATWRTSAFINRQQVSAAVAAMHGGVIGFRGRLGSTFSCYPILAHRTLALIFGAKKPPEPPPQFVLDDIRDVARPPRPPEIPSAVALANIPEKKVLPIFDARKAKLLLIAKRDGGDWEHAPTDKESRKFLLLTFRGVSNDHHRAIRHEVWPKQIKSGPRPRRNTAE